MGFHCGNTCSTKLAFHEMKNQKIMARTLPEEVTNGTLEGDLIPGHATVYRLQSTSDAGLRAYVQKERSFRYGPVPSEASVSSPSRKWDASTVMS